MPKKVEVKVTSDTVSEHGRRVDFEYIDPVTGIKMVKSILDVIKQSDDEIVSLIESKVKINIIASRANASSLVNRKITVEV
jgi:hypothetical protein